MNTLLSTLALLSLAAAPLSAQTAPAPVTMRDLSGALESVAARVAPSVVQVRVTAYQPDEEGRNTGALIATQRSTGSGVILSADGYIVTNAHVVQGGRRFVVAIPRPAASGVPGRSNLRPPSQEVPALLIGSDRETDLAVLKVDLTDLPFATLGDSDSLRPGHLVLAFGSPLGLASTVTMGVVSATNRQLADDDRMLYIQTDTPINPGNSGGPLVDATGRVMGINTLILSQSGGSEGIGFAAPSNIVRSVYQQIRQYRRVRRGEIGVFAQSVTPVLAARLKLPRDWGVVLGDVFPGSPADRAGLRVGDLVYSVDGKTMENGRQFDVDLYRKPIGNPVTLEVGRGPQRVIVKVPVVERRGDPLQFSDVVTAEQNLVPRLGFLGLDLNEQVAQLIPGLRAPRGVVVAAVAGDASSGLRAGDVIYAVDGAAIGSLAELRAAVDSQKSGGSLVLQVGREGQLRFLTVVLE
ncbi:MAG TPA: trypsin-like peptidase domain-containing protein [Gemmatimonadales bacterium]|nr:trypsin-like peptidase domain-containing protein [Gemmatimonadales bacterium]